MSLAGLCASLFLFLNWHHERRYFADNVVHWHPSTYVSFCFFSFWDLWFETSYTDTSASPSAFFPFETCASFTFTRTESPYLKVYLFPKVHVPIGNMVCLTILVGVFSRDHDHHDHHVRVHVRVLGSFGSRLKGFATFGTLTWMCLLAVFSPWTLSCLQKIQTYLTYVKYFCCSLRWVGGSPDRFRSQRFYEVFEPSWITVHAFTPSPFVSAYISLLLVLSYLNTSRLSKKACCVASLILTWMFSWIIFSCFLPAPGWGISYQIPHFGQCLLNGVTIDLNFSMKPRI